MKYGLALPVDAIYFLHVALILIIYLQLHVEDKCNGFMKKWTVAHKKTMSDEIVILKQLCARGMWVVLCSLAVLYAML